MRVAAHGDAALWHHQLVTAPRITFKIAGGGSEDDTSSYQEPMHTAQSATAGGAATRTRPPGLPLTRPPGCWQEPSARPPLSREVPLPAFSFRGSGGALSDSRCGQSTRPSEDRQHLSHLGLPSTPQLLPLVDEHEAANISGWSADGAPWNLGADPFVSSELLWGCLGPMARIREPAVEADSPRVRSIVDSSSFFSRPPAAALDDAKNHLRTRKVPKTCSFQCTGSCGLGPECRVARGLDERRQTPDLVKTKLCTKAHCRGDGCRFAHGAGDLCATDISV